MSNEARTGRGGVARLLLLLFLALGLMRLLAHASSADPGTEGGTAAHAAHTEWTVQAAWPSLYLDS